MDGLFRRLKAEYAARPVWMNLVFLFCVYMTFIYMPFDLFLKPVEEDQEVWFGFMLTGWAAKATEPIHWAIYGAGAWGFFRMRHWMWPWAALYTLQVAIAMAVWPIMVGSPWWVSVIAGAPFLGLAWLLHKSRPRFTTRAMSASDAATP